MVQQKQDKPKTGVILSVRNSLNSFASLGLVVDQEAALPWIERDPCVRYVPDLTNQDEAQDHIVVRWLDIKLSELAFGRTSLPEKEPGHHESGTEIVRWGYAQVSQSLVMAGPDVDSIAVFEFQANRFAHVFRFSGPTQLFHNLAILLDYLREVRKQPEELSSYERKYLAMLEEILPRPIS